MSNVKLFTIIYFFGLFFLPFIFWPNSLTPFEVPRVWFFNRWIELLLFVMFFSKVPVNKNISVKIIFFAFLFVIVSLITSLKGVDFSKSFWGNYWRSDGLFTLFHLYGLLVITALVWKKDWNLYLSRVFLISAVLISVLNILSLFLLHVFKLNITNFGGITGITFGQPNYLAGYLLVCLPFIFFLREGIKQKKIIDFAIFIVVLNILLTHSWGAVLGVILFLIMLSIKWRKWNVLMMLSLGLFLFGYLFLFKFESQISYIFEGRERILTKGFKAFEQKPLFGWGVSNFDYAFDSVTWPIHFNQDVYVDRAHSSILEILVASGFVGLISYMSLVVAVIYKTGKDFRGFGAWRLTLFTSLLLYLFHAQTNIISLNEEIFFWLVAGIIASGGQRALNK